MSSDLGFTTTTENGARALTAEGAAFRQTEERGERGAQLTLLSARLVGPRGKAKEGGVTRDEVRASVKAVLAESALLGGDALQQNVADLVTLVFEVCDILEGHGERTVFVWLFLAVLPLQPRTMLRLLRSVPHYACWRTLALLYEQATFDLAAGVADADASAALRELQAGVAALWARQLLVDDTRAGAHEAAVAAVAVPPAAVEAAAAAAAPLAAVPPAALEAAAAAPPPPPPVLSLAGKWAPRVGGAFDRRVGLAAHIIAAMTAIRAAGGVAAPSLRRRAAAAAEDVPMGPPADAPPRKAAAAWEEMDEDPLPVDAAAPSAAAAAALPRVAEALAGLPGFVGGPAGAAAAAVACLDKPAAAAAAARSPASNHAEMSYRRLLSRLHRLLDVAEVKMAGRRWAELVPEHVPSLANLKYRHALQNLVPPGRVHDRDAAKDRGLRAGIDMTGKRPGSTRSDDPDRVACAEHVRDAALRALSGEGGKRIKGARNQPHALVAEAITRCDRAECGDAGAAAPDPLLEAMWADLERGLREKAKFPRAVAIVDVSGSMAGLPMEAAIALGLLMSRLQPDGSPWRDRMITFHSDPSWVDVSGCATLQEAVAVTKAAPWGGSTAFGKAMRLILDLAHARAIPPDQMPTQLFCFSDMQFDEAAEVGAANAHAANHYGIRDGVQMGGADEAAGPFLVAGDDVRTAFREAGYAPPQLVFWNLRADGPPSFQAETATPGVALMSGFSAECLRQFCEEGALPPPPEPTAPEAEGDDEAMAAGGAAAAAAAPSARTPWDVLRAKLESARYDRVRAVLGAVGEGLLRGYAWVPPPRAEEGGGGGGAAGGGSAAGAGGRGRGRGGGGAGRGGGGRRGARGGRR